MSVDVHGGRNFVHYHCRGDQGGPWLETLIELQVVDDVGIRLIVGRPDHIQAIPGPE